MELEEIKTHLKALGYECTEDDDHMLEHLIGQVETYIKHYCNIPTVPQCLNHVWLNRVCGEFLQFKKSTGTLTGIEIEQVIKSVKDGDTTVEYATSTQTDSETLFNTYIKKLTDSHKTDLLRHRKLVW